MGDLIHLRPDASRGLPLRVALDASLIRQALRGLRSVSVWVDSTAAGVVGAPASGLPILLGPQVSANNGGHVRVSGLGLHFYLTFGVGLFSHVRRCCVPWHAVQRFRVWPI